MKNDTFAAGFASASSASGEPRMVFEENVEGMVIAGCLMERAALADTLRMVRPEMFYIEKNRLIFEAVAALYEAGQPVDLITVTEHLRRQGRLDEAGGAFYITRLSGSIASTIHLESHCALLFEYYVRRELVRRVLPLMADVSNVMADVFDLIVQMQRVLESLYENSPLENHLHTLPQVVDDTLQLIALRQASAANGLTGVPTGFGRLDALTGGWQKGNLIYLAGRPGDGKSAVALHMALTAARAGVPVLIYTLEMKATEIGERFVLAHADVDAPRLKQGRLTPEEVQGLEACREEAERLPVRVDDTPYLSVDHLCALVKAQHARQRCGLLVVDYLQLLATVSPGRTREQEVAECSRKLKALARSLDCPVLVASQLNRQAEELPTMPELRHLRESGAIEQDADVVMLIHRPERHHISVDPATGASTKGLGVLNVAKHRNGSTGVVQYRHNESMTRFRDDDTPAAVLVAPQPAQRRASGHPSYRRETPNTSAYDRQPHLFD